MHSQLICHIRYVKLCVLCSYVTHKFSMHTDIIVYEYMTYTCITYNNSYNNNYLTIFSIIVECRNFLRGRTLSRT